MIYFFKKLFHAKDIAHRYDQIFDLVKEVEPINIMEVGVWTGERARKMIKIAKKYHPQNSINYYGFDLFEFMNNDKFAKELSKQPPTIEEVERKLKLTGANIHLFKGDTVENMPRLQNNLPNMDLVFIDGGHSLGTIANDWLYTSKLLHKGSVVIFDDYWSNRTDAGSKVTVDNIDRKEYDVEILPTVDHFNETAFGPLTIQLAKITKI